MVANVDGETLRQWRDRLGFTAAEHTPGRHSLYSAEQICSLKLATTLVANGMRAGIAVAIAKQAVPFFAKLIAEIDQNLAIPHIAVIHRDCNGDDCDLFQVFCEAQIGDALANNVAIVVDLLAIAHHVVCRLQDEGHPIIETDREAFVDHARAIANGFAK